MMIIVSFYTADTPYEQEVERLLASVKKLGLKCDVVARPNQGNWFANCRLKPKVILEARERHPGEDVLWVDADAEFHASPEALSLLEADVAMRWTCHYRGPPNWSCGTIYTKPTSAATAFLKAWDWRCEMAHSRCDESAFRAMVTDGGLEKLKDDDGLVWGTLLDKYCRMFDEEGDRVIEHHQASRRLRKLV